MLYVERLHHGTHDQSSYEICRHVFMRGSVGWVGASSGENAQPFPLAFLRNAWTHPTLGNPTKRNRSTTPVTHMPAMRSMLQLLVATAASGLLINSNGGIRTAGCPMLRAANSVKALLQDADAHKRASAKQLAILGSVNAAEGGKIDDLNAFNLGGTISNARDLAELQGQSTQETSCNPLASPTGRRRAISQFSAWAFGSVACTAAAMADQSGNLNSFSQSLSVESTTQEVLRYWEQDVRAAIDSSAAAKADERQSLRAENDALAPKKEATKPAPVPYIFDTNEFNPTGFSPP